MSAMRPLAKLRPRLARLPVPLYGCALALLGLRLLIPASWPGTQGSLALAWLLGAGVIALAVPLLLHAAKALVTPQAFANDLRNPGTAPFFGQVGVALALLAEIQHQSGSPWAHACVLASAVVALVGLVHALVLVALQRPGWQAASPAWLLPPIQWLYLALLVPPPQAWLQQSATVLGLLTAALTVGCLASRWWWGPAWPVVAQPALGTFLAIPAVLLLLALQHPGPSPALTSALFGLTLFSALWALWQLPRFLARPFAISWWAYGMPLTACAMAIQAVATRVNTSTGLQLVAQLGSTLALVMTLGLLLAGGRATRQFWLSHSNDTP